jgi:hypothetical protein
VGNADQALRTQTLPTQEIGELHGTLLEGSQHGPWLSCHRIRNVNLEIQITLRQPETISHPFIETIAAPQYN